MLSMQGLLRHGKFVGIPTAASLSAYFATSYSKAYVENLHDQNSRLSATLIPKPRTRNPKPAMRAHRVLDAQAGQYFLHMAGTNWTSFPLALVG